MWEVPHKAHKIRGGEGKLLENCGKKGKKKKKGGGKSVKRVKRVKRVKKERERRKEERVEKREKGRLGCRPVTRYRKRRWKFACHVPSVHLCTKSDHVRTASETKKKKNCVDNQEKMHI